MAKCINCIHKPVCELWGGTFPTRTDVDKICEHYLQKKDGNGVCAEHYRKHDMIAESDDYCSCGTCPQCP